MINIETSYIRQKILPLWFGFSFLLEKVFSTICFLRLSYDNTFFHVGPYFPQSIYVPSKAYFMQLEITTII